MIFRRLRAAAPSIMAFILGLGLTLTAAAQAVKTEYVTTGEMHRFVIITFLTGAGTVLTGLAVVYGLVDRAKSAEIHTLIKANVDAIQANADQVKEILAVIKEHHLDPAAHPIGSAARIDPINEKLGEMHTALTTLVAEHRVIREQEDEVCAVMRMRGKGPSPERRGTDPDGFDGRKLRGRQ